MGTTSATGSRKTRLPTGMTLMELILVMVLLLLVLATVAPRLGPFSRGRVLVSEAEVVLAMLRTARDRSAAEAVPYRLQVEAGSCRLVRQAGSAFEPLPDRPDGRHVLAEGLTMRLERLDASDADFVEFRPTGECTPARVELVDDDHPPAVLTARTALEPFRLIEPGEEDLP